MLLIPKESFSVCTIVATAKDDYDILSHVGVDCYGTIMQLFCTFTRVVNATVDVDTCTVV
jgi:hypothetical protein